MIYREKERGWNKTTTFLTLALISFCAVISFCFIRKPYVHKDTERNSFGLRKEEDYFSALD